MSTIEVNKIAPVSGGTNVTLGDSGDTFTIPSGVTMTTNGSSSGFAPAGISSASTSGTALQITSGNIVGAGSDATNVDLGVGIHIKTADSSASANSDADEMVIENGTSGAGVGISLLSATNGEGRIVFGNSADDNAGQIFYNHGNDNLAFYTGGNQRLVITDTGIVSGESGGSDIFQARNTTNGNRNYRGLSDGGGQTYYVTEDGAGYFAGGTSSDATLKNVVENTPHGLDKIKDVQPKTYYWKKRGVDVDGNEIESDDNLDERKHYGVLAQDLQTVLPEITYGTEGNMSVDYNGLLMVAMNSIKELKTKVETLEAKVAALESA